jgi:hypothetical protein
MRSERARFLDRRKRRASDESSPFSSLGKTGVVSRPLPRAFAEFRGAEKNASGTALKT